jgi:predicted aspartyl protease
MSVPFSPGAPTLIVPVTVIGPGEGYTFRCALDTGSTRTVLPTRAMRRLGFDLTRPVGRARLRAATGVAVAPLVRVPAITAVDRVRPDFTVAVHELPLGVEADGLLGLDFLRGLVLTIDFARGRIALARPSWWRFWN